MIKIDGSYMEGGGQIIRTAVALSAITHQDCKIFNIRAKRKKTGLQIQHVEAIKSVANICNASVVGAELHSSEITFKPGDIVSKNISINIPTAGSIGLVLQPLMITALQTKMNVEINGGATNGKWAPPVNYIKFVILPLLKKIGYKADIIIKKYGYYPKGGAQVQIFIEPSSLSGIEILDKGKPLGYFGISHASTMLKKSRVAERQKSSANETIAKSLGKIARIKTEYSETICPGSGVELFAAYEHSILGSNALGERGKKAEDVGQESAENLNKYIIADISVDKYAQDQLIPFMALAKGSSKIKINEITNHTKSNIWVVKKFLPVKFTVEGGMLSCTGKKFN